MQRYPPIFVLLQQDVRSRCCQIINSVHIPSPDGRDHWANIPWERNKKKRMKISSPIYLNEILHPDKNRLPEGSDAWTWKLETMKSSSEFAERLFGCFILNKQLWFKHCAGKPVVIKHSLLVCLNRRFNCAHRHTNTCSLRVEKTKDSLRLWRYVVLTVSSPASSRLNMVIFPTSVTELR